ncbi:MAG TPA: tryptophan--tRNA ligase [Ruminiclostridium sp.]
MVGTEQKKRIFSGVQPSGNLTIGNYLGAIKNWIPMQDEFECLYCVVDLHTLTVRQKPAELRQRSLNLLALYMACGLDPQKSILFLQSHVSAHAELAWILNCYTYMGELNRMTQFKDKSLKYGDNINAGLLTYPVLMAADILLYQADLVPIGQDQKQHLEITRDIAERFNKIYGDTFTIPEAYIPKIGAKIMSLQEPEKKMSKSDENENAYVFILDSEDAILRKFKRAVTDSEREIRYDEVNKPGVSNLISIYSGITNKSFVDIEKEFEGRSYGDLKEVVGQSVAEMLKPIQQKYNELSSNKDYLNSILKENAEKAAYMARKTLSKVHRKIGLVPK